MNEAVTPCVAVHIDPKPTHRIKKEIRSVHKGLFAKPVKFSPALSNQAFSDDRKPGLEFYLCAAGAQAV
ncbi:MAG: hypothetical protein ABSB50_14970 [Terracidiphilus sp.]